MAIKYINAKTFNNKTILVRVDVNVPIKNNKVDDDFRIQSIIPTIKLLKQGHNRVILCGHLGRPEGEWEQSMSLKPVARELAFQMGYKFLETDHELGSYPDRRLIFFSGNLMEDKHLSQLKLAPEDDLLFLENLRFYPQEEQNAMSLATRLATCADAYVDEAFSVTHHKAVSISAITKLLPCYGGPLLEQEIKALTFVLERRQKPFVLMMGGIKISDKIEVLEHLGKQADSILLGGGLASLVFASRGYEVGISKIEKEALNKAFQVDKNFKDKLILPVDVVVANKGMDKDSIRVCSPHEVRKNEQMLDAGPKTILQFAGILKASKTIVWNGPLGLFEHKPFHTATIALAQVIGGLGKRKAYTLVGGGETVDAVRQAGQLENIDHVSTGGGAMLEFLAGKKLPGIEALK
jgi:phosphoglycerate kinase